MEYMLFIATDTDPDADREDDPGSTIEDWSTRASAAASASRATASDHPPMPRQCVSARASDW